VDAGFLERVACRERVPALERPSLLAGLAAATRAGRNRVAHVMGRRLLTI
jgi:hypothetical protein